MPVTHNVPEVLKSAKVVHRRVALAHRKTANRAGRHMRDKVRENVPARRGHSVGGFEGYKATGHLRREIVNTTPRQRPRAGDWTSDVLIRDAHARMYGIVHEKGKTITAKRAPYLVFKVHGQWVRTKSVKIRRKRWFYNGWVKGARSLPKRLVSDFKREVRVR